MQIFLVSEWYDYAGFDDDGRSRADAPAASIALTWEKTGLSLLAQDSTRCRRRVWPRSRAELGQYSTTRRTTIMLVSTTTGRHK